MISTITLLVQNTLTQHLIIEYQLIVDILLLSIN